jgi:hypothetical protein
MSIYAVLRLVKKVSVSLFLLPGLSAAEIKTLIKEHCAKLSIPSYRLDDLFVVPAVETDRRTEIVQTLASAVEAMRGARP